MKTIIDAVHGDKPTETKIPLECFMCPVWSYTMGVKGHCVGCKFSIDAEKYGTDQAANLRRMVAEK